ncbi:MAG: RNA 2',3'-cyclic phosphodiesterase [Bacteroidetes bacterium]|nr:RNA 2',3'-cyclic phosphodiesterase [Bacteroidota bacterium]
MTIRTFVALEIPDDALTQIIDLRDDAATGLKNVRWEPKEKLHLTLKFLGDTKEELVNEYAAAIEETVGKFHLFKLTFKEFGIFKKDNTPKILWAGLEENPQVVRLANELDKLFGNFGFERERRRFKSHITLLRFRGYEDQKKILSLLGVNIPQINFISEKVFFFESRLLPSGSIYRAIRSFNLKN